MLFQFSLVLLNLSMFTKAFITGLINNLSTIAFNLAITVLHYPFPQDYSNVYSKSKTFIEIHLYPKGSMELKSSDLCKG